MFDTEIAVDKHEIPGSFSTGFAYEDQRFRLNLGGGSSYGEGSKLVITITFKDLGLHVTGGQSMLESVSGLDRSEWCGPLFEYTIAALIKSGQLYSVLKKLLSSEKSKGLQEGEEDAQQAMRTALGLD